MHKTLDKRFAEVYNNAIFAGTVPKLQIYLSEYCKIGNTSKKGEGL